MALIKEKGAKDDTAVALDFGQAQAALATGKYEEIQYKDAELGPEIQHGVMGDDPSVTDAKDAKNAPKAATKADAK